MITSRIFLNSTTIRGLVISAGTTSTCVDVGRAVWGCQSSRHDAEVFRISSLPWRTHTPSKLRQRRCHHRLPVAHVYSMAGGWPAHRCLMADSHRTRDIDVALRHVSSYLSRRSELLLLAGDVAVQQVCFSLSTTVLGVLLLLLRRLSVSVSLLLQLRRPRGRCLYLCWRYRGKINFQPSSWHVTNRPSSCDTASFNTLWWSSIGILPRCSGAGSDSRGCPLERTPTSWPSSFGVEDVDHKTPPP